MKIKTLFTSLLVLTILICTCVLPTSAKENINNALNEDTVLVEIIRDDNYTQTSKYNDSKLFYNNSNSKIINR